MEYDFRRKVAFLGLALLVLSLFVTTIAQADELYGRIGGVATDTTVAVVPGVAVKLTNSSTGITQEIVTGSDGGYAFVNLKPGTYEISATKTGFKAFSVKGIQVEPNQIFVQNVPMEGAR